MADKKITALTALTATGKDSAADLLHIIDYSASPVNKKISVANLFSNVNTDTHIYGSSKVFEVGQAAAVNSHLRVAIGASASADGAVTINDDGEDFVDFVVKTGESDQALVIDGGTDTVTINGDGKGLDFQVNGENTDKMLFVDASADVLGVGIAAPATAYMLDVGEVGSGATGKSLQCAGGADIGGNSTITGSLGVTGATTLTGDLTSTGKVMTSTVAHSAAGALPLTARTVLLTVDGTKAYTLPNGTSGQQLSIVCVAATNTPDGTVSAVSSNFQGFSTLDVDAVGEAFELLYVNSKWHLLHAPRVGAIT